MTDRIKALTELRDAVAARADMLRSNAHRAGKEGRGTHRNAGDSGRVAALWIECRRELATLDALIAQETRT